MMTNLCCEVLSALTGQTLATAESCTGGMLGAGLTDVPGSSAVYKGGVISYTNEVKERLLGVPKDLLGREGAVSAPVAEAMALGACKVLCADYAVSVTGLAGPGGDDYGNPVGTVYIGCASPERIISKVYHFQGNRESVRKQAAVSALELLLHEVKRNGDNL